MEENASTNADDLGDKEAVFLAKAEDALDWAKAQVSWRTRTYRRLRVALLVTTAAIPVLAATSAPRWVLALLGSLGLCIEGVITIWRHRELLPSEVRLRARLEKALTVYRVGARPYDDPNTRFDLFVADVEEIIEEGDWAEVKALEAVEQSRHG